jgi:hypothetical protein
MNEISLLLGFAMLQQRSSTIDEIDDPPVGAYRIRPRTAHLCATATVRNNIKHSTRAYVKRTYARVDM